MIGSPPLRRNKPRRRRTSGTEIDRITADLRSQLAVASEPFVQRVEAAKAEAQAINREAEVQKAIERITPKADTLREAIGKVFADKPALHWSGVLHDIADETKVDGVAGGGGAP